MSFFGDIFKNLFGIEDEPKRKMSSEINIDNTLPPPPIIYGSNMVDASLAFKEISQDKKYLYFAAVIGQGEIRSIDEIYLDDKPIGEYASRSISKDGQLKPYDKKDIVVMQIYRGTDDQLASPLLMEHPKWTSDHRLRGVVYLAIRLKYSSKYFTQPPTIKVSMRGRLLLNFRNGRTSYSNNPALCLYDYLINPRYGAGLNESDLDIAAFTKAANDCDRVETLLNKVEWGKPSAVFSNEGILSGLHFTTPPADATSLPGATISNAQTNPSKTAVLTNAYKSQGWFGTVGKFVVNYEMVSGDDFTSDDTIYVDGDAHRLLECNAIINVEKDLFSNIEVFKRSFRAALPSQPKFKPVVIRDRAPSFSLSEDTVIGGINMSGDAKSSRFNTFTVTFRNPNNNWKKDIAVFPEPGSDLESQMLAQDNGTVLKGSLDSATTINYYAARDMARILVLESRNSLSISAKLQPTGLNIEVGDVIEVSDQSYGWNGKEFRVEKVSLHPDVTISIDAVEHLDDIYTYEYVDINRLSDNTDLPDFFLPAPQNLSAISEFDFYPGGATIYIKVDWDDLDIGLVEWYELQWRPTRQAYWSKRVPTIMANEPWVSIQTRESKISIDDMRWLSTNDIRVRAISVFGSKSEWSDIVEHVVLTDTTAPGLPIIESIAGFIQQLGMVIRHPDNFDFKHCEIYYSTSDLIPAEPVFTSSSTSIIIPGLDDDTAYFVWLIAVDDMGNKSAATTSSTVSTRAKDDYISSVPGADGADGQDGLGLEYIFARSTGATITIAKRPSNGWKFDTPGVVGGLSWSDSAPGITESIPYLWRSQRQIVGAPNTGDSVAGSWSPPVIVGRYGIDGTAGVDGIDGSNGTDAAGIEHIFTAYSSSTLPSTRRPTNSWGFDSPGTARGQVWHDAAPALSSSKPYMFESQRAIAGTPTVGSKTGVTGTWSIPSVVSHYGTDGNNGSNGSNGRNGTDGDDGDDGDKGNTGNTGRPGSDGSDGDDGADGPGIEYIFRSTTTNSRPATPSSTRTARNTNDYVPTLWKDDASDVTAQNPYLWACKRTTSSSSLYKWTTWTSPVLWSSFSAPGGKGDKGEPGTAGSEAYAIYAYKRSVNKPSLTTATVTTMPSGWLLVPQATPTTQKLWKAGVKITVTGTNGSLQNIVIKYKFGPVELTTYSVEAANTTGGTGGTSAKKFSDLQGKASVAQIPNLPAAKITSGTLPVNRGGTGVTTSTGTGKTVRSATPTFTGTPKFSERLTHSGDSDTYLMFGNNNIQAYAGGKQYIALSAFGFVAGTSIYPIKDNTHDLGVSTRRWDDIHATNGTIKTSDRRRKDNVTEIDVDIAMQLVDLIEWVNFKWKNYSQEATYEDERLVTTREDYDEEEVYYEIIDGQAHPRTRTITSSREVLEAFPLVDESGELVMEDGVQVFHSQPATTMEKVMVSGASEHEFSRTHAGIVAQQFEEVLTEMEIDANDMAALIHDKEHDIYGVRYEELIPYVAAALKGLNARVKELEA